MFFYDKCTVSCTLFAYDTILFYFMQFVIMKGLDKCWTGDWYIWNIVLHFDHLILLLCALKLTGVGLLCMLNRQGLSPMFIKCSVNHELSTRLPVCFFSLIQDNAPSESTLRNEFMNRIIPLRNDNRPKSKPKRKNVCGCTLFRKQLLEYFQQSAK